jgi:hypothetical protein
MKTANDYARERQLMRDYGLTLEQFAGMIVRQNGCCLICHEPMKPAMVDHDHDTGIVRGLLCGTCNTGLGMFKDDIRLLAAAIVYLEDHKLSFKSQGV